MAQKRGEVVIRFLQCSICGNSLSLPAKGEIVPLSSHCPLCSYSLLQVRSGKMNVDGYFLCPFCYSNPSARNGIDIESLPVGFTLPCFKCNCDCPFASLFGAKLSFVEPEEVVICPCYDCRKGQLILRKTRTKNSFSIRCSASNCRCGVLFNEALIQDVKTSHEICHRCSGKEQERIDSRFVGDFNSIDSSYIPESFFGTAQSHECVYMWSR